MLLKIQHLFHLLTLPSKHSRLGNFIFDLLYEELYLAFTCHQFLNDYFIYFIITVMSNIVLVLTYLTCSNVSALSLLNALQKTLLFLKLSRVLNFCPKFVRNEIKGTEN